ncbi:MAG: hypothetical protein WC476_06670 [Phycisphaerae bacterium]|jgi:hypothetical protein
MYKRHVMVNRRKLTPGETHVLELIRHIYGDRNTEDEVFFPSEKEAAIFVLTTDGSSPLMVHLTNLAEWRSDGTIASDEELKKNWLMT